MYFMCSFISTRLRKKNELHIMFIVYLNKRWLKGIYSIYLLGYYSVTTFAKRDTSYTWYIYINE